jgi:uncharacterized protein
MKAKIVLWVAAGFVVLAFLSYPWGQKFELKTPLPAQAGKFLKINNTTLNIEVADTDAGRIQGLSGRSGFAENAAMLFVFSQEGNYSFWMKDMNFPIDIAWMDKDKKIIYIENSVSPDTYPKSFGPSAPSMYVLETNAGFFEKYGIKIGDTAEF